MPQRVFIVLLGCFDCLAGLLLAKRRLFPLVEVGDGVLCGGKRAFLADGHDPLFDGGFVVVLQLIEFCSLRFHGFFS